MVGIKVIAENVRRGTVKHTNTSYFMMVANDDDGTLSEVPPLLLENANDVRRFLEAIKRRELRQSYSEHFDHAKTRMLVADSMEQLKNERVVLSKNW